MHVIKHGNFVHDLKDTRSAEFHCVRCKCNFVAKPGEYSIGKKDRTFLSVSDSSPRITIGASVCPECGELVLLPERVIKFIEERDKITNLEKLLMHAGCFVLIESKTDDFISGIYKVIVNTKSVVHDENGVRFRCTIHLYSEKDHKLITLGKGFNFKSVDIYRYDEKKE